MHGTVYMFWNVTKLFIEEQSGRPDIPGCACEIYNC